MKPPTPPLERAVQSGEASHADEEASGTHSLNSPEIGNDGKPTQRAVTTAKQAHSIAKKIRDRAKTGRIATAATIAAKYNGEAPFLESDLSRTGQTWRNNFSTNFLASIIDRVKPQLLDPLAKADILTHSVLPASVEDSAKKSRKFCEVTTKVIRRWPSWKDFTSQLSQENVLFGLAVPGWIDNPTEWRPRLWRFDEAYLPEGTGQHASTVQVAVFTQRMLIHEFIQLFQDRKLAEKACYNVPNCIRAANNAGKSASNRKGDETDLEKQDRLREGVGMADSYDDQAKTVDLFHVLVRDYTGGVDLWTVTQDDGLEVRCVENIHEDIIDALTLFTFQSGNNKLYGSKGLGRLLTNLHIAIERGRCLGADQMYLSGLVIFKTDKKDAVSLQARVRHPFIFVGKDMDVVSEQIAFNVQAFEVMDAKLTSLADSIAGAFIPPNLDQTGSPNTKIEAAQRAERELAVKEGVLGRFFDHVADLVSAMQRKIYCAVNLREGKRAYDKKLEKTQRGVRVVMRKVWKLLKDAFGNDNKTEPDIEGSGIADEEAVSAVVELLEAGLTVEDIATLAQSPSSQNNADEGASRDQRTLDFITNNAMNPHIDQKAATELSAKIAMGDDRAKQLVISGDDANVEKIAIRQQIIECSEMLDGEPMPVAGGDKHDTHRKILAGKMDAIMSSVRQAPTEAMIKAAGLFIAHYADHIALDATMPPDQKQAENKAIQGDWNEVDQINQAMQKQKADAAAAGVTAGPDGLPVPVPAPGQPPQVDPATGQITGEDQAARAAALGQPAVHPEDAKLHLGIKDRELRERELDLKAQDQDHRQAMDVLKLQQDNVKVVQQAAQDTSKINQQEADRELQREAAAAGPAAT